MKEISNKVLMYVLFVAVVVSIGSMMYTFGAISKTTSPTGMATTEGTVDVAITSTYVVNLTDTTIDYGTGSLTDTYESCLLNSTDSVPAACWTNSTLYATDSSIGFENIGSDAIDVEINGTTAANFIGGTGATFVADCTCGSGTPGTDLTIALAHQDCCDGLTATGSDTGTLVTQLNVVAGSSTGTANLYFYGTAD
ncbi:MAG: hypothetical protein KAQ83_00710 [Nanoarchaeota archaeon]|nr:hypothetical protein [Nanoarchaeota archaeon]